MLGHNKEYKYYFFPFTQIAPLVHQDFGGRWLNGRQAVKVNQLIWPILSCLCLFSMIGGKAKYQSVYDFFKFSCCVALVKSRILDCQIYTCTYI